MMNIRIIMVHNICKTNICTVKLVYNEVPGISNFVLL